MRAVLAALALAACAPAAPPEPSRAPTWRDADATVASKADFEMRAFAGTWHEAARLPVAFQYDCAAGRWRVGPPAGDVATLRTTCVDGGGATVRRIDGTLRHGRLGRLRADLDHGAWEGDLWVLWADATYRSAVVASPDGRAAWILDRSPSMPPDRLRAAREVLRFNGYDTDALIGG
ncbi:lipocalin family protein [Jannaschia sp. Os4]|uniref:lipocalin family protein n=1 Tax=Jannaschia sp. Os4 TaxID=2807617 RepID=UPI00193987C6|nr:lipocalin family protein [Jannaschia sp. Os4]MBM2574858.1 lipocalin family protein [Jannaschia sp. Os4]